MFTHALEEAADKIKPELVLVSAGFDRTLIVWDLAGRGPQLTLEHGLNTVNYATFSPDGKWIVAAGSDNVIKTWDAVSGQERPAW